MDTVLVLLILLFMRLFVVSFNWVTIWLTLLVIGKQQWTSATYPKLNRWFMMVASERSVQTAEKQWPSKLMVSGCPLLQGEGVKGALNRIRLSRRMLASLWSCQEQPRVMLLYGFPQRLVGKTRYLKKKKVYMFVCLVIFILAMLKQHC